MLDPASVSENTLRIVHVLRSPVGGLFRHVMDLADQQIARGHKVGIIADSSTGGAHAETLLATLAPRLALGLARLPMRRDPHPLDVIALTTVARHLRRLRPDVVHGHGAKGALYPRLPGATPLWGPRPARVYTPHGGSLHYDPRSLKGALVLAMERLLSRRTDLILFESQFAAERFRAAIGAPSGLVRIVHNGLRPPEFEPVTPAPEASDILYIGEMRLLKGVDVLLRAIAQLRSGRGAPPVRATLVGDGPDRDAFEALARELGIAEAVTFRPPMPAREAFALGRLLIVPSRAESLPYIVLEAAAAQVPMIATRVGGIPEIFGAAEYDLVAPDDVAALAGAIGSRLAMPDGESRATAFALGRFVETRFAVARMTDDVIASYRDALAAGLKHTVTRVLTPRLPRYGL